MAEQDSEGLKALLAEIEAEIAERQTTADFIRKRLGQTPDDVRALDAVVRREGADIGVLLSFEPATKPMRTDAASMGFYESPWGKHPRLQLLTVAELLEGKQVDYPRTAGVNQTYKQAPRQLKKVAEQRDAFGDRS